MSRLSSILLACVIAATAADAAPHVLNPAARITAAHTPAARIQAAQRYVPLVVQLAGGATVDDLLDLGAVVFNRRDDLVLACIPSDKIADIDNSTIVCRAEAGTPASTYLDVARPATGVDILTSADCSLGQYTGRGVVVGFADDGFDPGHAAFAGRVVRLSHYDELSASRTYIADATDLADYTTDNTSMFHATHVAGILAGGYGAGIYRGVAPESDIVATTSNLYDVGILAGVEDVIAYAKEVGRPAVVNLSLGTTIGPHDGTDLFSQYLDRCGEDAVIVLAAGNDGDLARSFSHTFTDDCSTVSIMPASTIDWEFKQLKGACDIWSADNRPVSVGVRIYDIVERRFIYSSEIADGSEHSNASESIILSSDDDPAFAAAYTGTLAIASERSPLNDRYNVYISCDLTSTATTGYNQYSRYYLAIDITGNKDTSIDCCAGGGLYFAVPPILKPILCTADCHLSISSMACGRNTITIGNATTRDVTPTADGSRSWQDMVTAGTVCNTTSYGTLRDGRTLPHICAPGSMIVSACNRYYEGSPDFTVAGSGYIAETGTSMAAPHAAGIFALWLQADPTLTVADIRDIAVATARPWGDRPDDPRCGAGMIDAVAGMRMVLDRAGIAEPEELLRPGITRRGDRLAIDTNGCDIIAVSTCDVAGRAVDPDRLPAGIILVAVTTSTGTYRYKVR